MVLLHKNVSDHILVYSVQWRKIEGILIFFHMDGCIYFYRILLKIRYKWNPSSCSKRDELNYNTQYQITVTFHSKKKSKVMLQIDF